MTERIRRRRLLAALAGTTAGLAGCSTGGTDEDRETLTPGEVPSPEGIGRTTVGTPTRTTAVSGPAGWNLTGRTRPGTRRPARVRLRTGPRVLTLAPARHWTPQGVVVAVKMTGTATADSPARVRALLYNASYRTVDVDLAEVAPFASPLPTGVYEPPVGATDARDVDASVVLVPTEDHDLVTPDVGVERGPEGYWHATAATTDRSLPGTVTLDPESSVEAAFLVCGAPDSAGLPPGRYRFSDAETGVGGRFDETLTAVVWNPEVPGPRRESRFAGAPAPLLRRGVAVGWFHRPDDGSMRFLVPGAETVTLPADLTLRLVNRGVVWRGGRLTLYKYSRGEWYHVGPRPGVHLGRGARGIEPVRPDGVAAFDRRLTRGRPADADGDGFDFDDRRAIGYLGGGRYAFVVVPPTSGPAWQGALVRVNAEPVSPRVQPGVTVERDGERVVVTDPAVPNPAAATAVAVARRVTGTDGRRVLPEQVMGRFGFGRALWNTLPAFEPGVETVAYYADRTLRSRSLATVLGQAVDFEGSTVRVSLAPDG